MTPCRLPKVCPSLFRSVQRFTDVLLVFGLHFVSMTVGLDDSDG